MAEFNIQSDSVDVTQIMDQLRQRIREKRGTDYTEQQTRELATVKLERFLDPRQVRSDLVEHYRRLDPPAALDPIPHERPGPAPEPYAFDQETIYASSRGPMGKLIRLIRSLLNPFLKLFFNPTTIVHAMTRQAEINAWTLQLLQQQTDLAERVTKQFERAGAKFAAREELDALNYEVLNNLVVEMTRLTVDMKNHKMRVESVAGRLDFDERRARALESVVQKRSERPHDSAEGGSGESTSLTGSDRPRRRRRRLRRRTGAAATPDAGAGNTGTSATLAQDTPTEPAPSADTAALPADTAPGDTVAPQSQTVTPPPAPSVEPSTAAPETSPPPPTIQSSPDPDPPAPPAVPPLAHGESPTLLPASPTPGQRDAPAPATARTTKTVAPPSPSGGADTDEQ